MKKLAYTLLTLLISLCVYAGGNPVYVNFPEGYKSDFTQYNVRNRGNGKQLAVLYANETAINSANSGQLANGSKIIMEVYKTKLDENGNAITDTSGLFEKGKFAAIAVMEKKSDWNTSFSAEDRAGDWGFAIYNTDGTPKENNLECATCHKPMPDNDYLFSFSSLVEYSQNK